ncbi:Uncharacterized protein PBTT_04760 [Plasmodiophora brassicae]
MPQLHFRLGWKGGRCRRVPAATDGSLRVRFSVGVRCRIGRRTIFAGDDCAKTGGGVLLLRRRRHSDLGWRKARQYARETCRADVAGRNRRPPKEAIDNPLGNGS